MDAAEMLLELWSEVLWRSERGLRSESDRTTVVDPLRSILDEPMNSTEAEPPGSFLSGTSTEELKLSELTPELRRFLGLEPGQNWQPSVPMDCSTVSTPIKAREVVRVLNTLIKTRRRSRLLGDACVSTAVWKRNAKELRKLCHWARTYYKVSANDTTHEGTFAMTMWLGLYTVVPPSKTTARDLACKKDFESRLTARLSQRPPAYFDLVAEVDLKFIDLVAGSDQGSTRVAELQGNYEDLKRRFAPDRRAREQTGRTMQVLTRVAERHEQLQALESQEQHPQAAEAQLENEASKTSYDERLEALQSFREAAESI
jgi:hypothetical protein